MASVNKVILVGNLGRDPEVRYLPSGDPVANISIATTSKYKGKDGNVVEETEWHRITFFGRLAEVVGEYLHKGRSVYIEGRIKTSKYTDKDGVEKYSTDIIANEMQMLGANPDHDGGQQHGNQQRQQPARQDNQRQQPDRQQQGNYQRTPQGNGQQPRQQTGGYTRGGQPQHNEPRRQPPHRPASGFDDMDDDIPF